MATTAEHPYEDTLDDMAQAIRRLRRDCPPREVAREILTYDQPGHTHVVGIDRRGQRVTLYHCVDQYAIAVEFGVEGLADGGPRIARFDAGAPDVRRWVEKKRNSWGWIHPRYR